MLHTTFHELQEKGACTDGYKKLAKSMGGVRSYGKNEPIPLDKVLQSNGLSDTIWSFRATLEPSGNLLIEFACCCAEHVLHIFEEAYPDDKRPRLAIVAAKRFLSEKNPAAGAAASAATWVAAWAAIWDAAWAAGAAASEEQWQSATLLKLLEGA